MTEQCWHCRKIAPADSLRGAPPRCQSCARQQRAQGDAVGAVYLKIRAGNDAVKMLADYRAAEQALAARRDWKEQGEE